MKKIIRAFSFLLISLQISHAQRIISTVAGTGAGSFSGDNSPATAAHLYGPEDVVFDAAGNYYISDEENGAIRKVNTAGIITTIAGTGTPGYNGDGGQATTTQLDWPVGLAIDAAGNIYVGDMLNQCIRKINTSGVINIIAGNKTAGFLGDGSQATAAELNTPRSIALDASQANLYISDQNNNRIRKVNLASGIISTVAGNGTAGFNSDGIAATAAELNLPYGIILDAANNLYITDQTNHRIRKVNTSGIITTIAGDGTGAYNGDGIPATAAEVYLPAGIVIGPGGDILIGDTFNNRVRMIAQWNGDMYTIAGNGNAGYTGDGFQATAAEMHYPAGIGCDAHGNLFVGDWSNNVIREITNADVETVIQTTHSSSITVYPNPASNLLNINLNTLAEKVIVNLYNMLGQEVYNKTYANSSTIAIPVNNFQTGTYLLNIKTNDGVVLTKKVEIAR